MAVKTSLTASELPDHLGGLRSAIEKAIPHGRTDNGGPNDRGAWSDVPQTPSKEWTKLKKGYDAIVAKHRTIDRGATATQLGTLGTGNHFIEICLDESGPRLVHAS